jgi:glycosyltransferase involved in cell wall biosynthesis
VSAKPVTVLMAAFNDEDFLPACLDSILCQSFSEFSAIVIDDGSTDASSAILHAYARKDSRLRVITNDRNIGLTASLNKGLALIDSPYIARMDADDVCLPERFQKQYAFMEAHPEFAAAGSYVRTVDADGAPLENAWFQVIREHTDFDSIHAALKRGESVIVHPSSFLRTGAVNAVKGYNECFTYAQDYDLWLRLSEKARLAVIPEELLEYRVHARAISAERLHEQKIANVCALALSILRTRGDAMPECPCSGADYPYMENLADRAGPLAWARWLELNAYGNTSLTEEALLLAFQKILTFSPDELVREKLRAFFIYQIHCSSHLGVIIEEMLQRSWPSPYFADYLVESRSHTRNLETELYAVYTSRSYKITAPLRFISAMAKKLLRRTEV